MTVDVRKYEQGDAAKIRPKDLYNPEKDKDMADRFEETAKDPRCWVFTVTSDSYPIAVIGGCEIYTGVADLWSITSDRVFNHPIGFFKAVTGKIKLAQETLNLHRIQTYIRSDIPYLHKWAQMLGMTPEGVLKKFYGKIDHHIYARTW